MITNPDKQFLDTMSRDPCNWRGPFYFNRKDPRLMVPKLYPSLGWTLNFASPLPFINLASQKNHIALYHMGLNSNKELLSWFTDEYSKQTKLKPDMGKGCIRFKKPENIPYKLIWELVSRVSVKDWITNYEKNIRR